MHLLLRYTLALITQMTQTAVCNRHHSLDQQLCRWLLLSLDRLQSNELIMTQELMANMLGVRREGVTEAAGKLQADGLIQYSRGRIKVLDRPGLEARVCECYDVVRRESARLLPLTRCRAGSRPFGALAHRLRTPAPRRLARSPCRHASRWRRNGARESLRCGIQGVSMSTPSLRLRAFIACGRRSRSSHPAAGPCADPPSRVARLGYITGAVSFSPAGENDWVQAALNRPLTTGDRLWVDAGGAGRAPGRRRRRSA